MDAAKNIKLDDVESLRQALSSVAETDDSDKLIELVISLLVRMSNENKRLQLRLQKALRSVYGRKSEKLNSAQLALFQELLGDAKEDASSQPDDATSKDTDNTEKGKKSKSKGHGRNRLPENLPRVENRIAVPAAERTCSRCGGEKECIGHEVSERLDYVPASLRVICDMREKVACKPCQGNVGIAPVADKVTEGGLAAEGLLAHVLVSKYVDGLPLTRLAKIYARQGVDLAESTLGDFVRQATGALASIARFIENQVLASYCINQDDSGLRVLDRDHPKGVKRGHIWAYVGDACWVAYRYTPDWRGEHPRDFMSKYGGFIQGDGYAGINKLFEKEGGSPTRVGCMMHCRRYFFDAHKAGDIRAGVPLALFNEIYAIERRAKEQNCTSCERLLMRQSESVPLMERLYAWIESVAGHAAPKTDLGKAITYARNQWPHLMVAFSDGRLEIDNGEAERRLRLLATGRKNWLFAGSDKGGERAAVALTVLGTAVANGVDPLAYVTHILRRIAAGCPSSELPALMPLAWAHQHGQQIRTEQPALPRLIN